MSTTAIKKFWRISEVCNHLSVGETFVRGLVDKGMLDLVHLPSPSEHRKSKTGKKRDGLPRITGESLDRYERGEVVAPERAVTLRASTSRRSAKPALATTNHAGFAHFQ